MRSLVREVRVLPAAKMEPDASDNTGRAPLSSWPSRAQSRLVQWTGTGTTVHACWSIPLANKPHVILHQGELLATNILA